MHLSITDLPVPEPPMTTSDSPGVDVEVDAVEHDLAAEALLDAAQFDFAVLCRVIRHREKNTEVRR